MKRKLIDFCVQIKNIRIYFKTNYTEHPVDSSKFEGFFHQEVPLDYFSSSYIVLCGLIFICSANLCVLFLFRCSRLSDFMEVLQLFSDL